jgi:hypothetical protein
MGTKEMQAANYRNRKETEQKRKDLFNVALDKFRKNDIQGVSPISKSGTVTQQSKCVCSPGEAGYQALAQGSGMCAPAHIPQ